MKIVTGRTGTPHITSDDDRANNAGTYGKNYYVLNINDCLSAEIISANEVKLNSGELMLQGTHARIEYGDSETVTIADGESGYKRIDLIVARYIKSSGFESVQLAVIKGTPAKNNPSVPNRQSTNILHGASIYEMPLYKVIIDGVNLTKVERAFPIVPSLSELQSNTTEEIERLNSNLNDLDNNYTQFSAETNQKLSQADAQFTQINAEISNLTDADTQMSAKITGLQESVNNLSSVVGKLTSDYQKLNERVTVLEGKVNT